MIHPDDRQLAQESNQDVAKGILLGGVLPGVIKGVDASGKSLSKFFTKESSEANIYDEFNKISDPKVRYEYLSDEAKRWMFRQREIKQSSMLER